jgi:Fe-Mn family superoxide dismutase
MNRRDFIRLSFQAGSLAMLQMATGCKFGEKAAGATIDLAPLPYAENALEPYISAHTISYHYGKHHQAYVDAVNRLATGARLSGAPLEKIIITTRGKQERADLFNNAAQVFNHDFYWKSMTPGGGGAPKGPLADMIADAFKSYEGFQREFTDAAGSWFGSGWIWLVEDGGALKIVCTPNGDTPLGRGPAPLLTLDLWEHAYYLDYQNRRGEYIEAFLQHLVNWEHAASLLNQSSQAA